MGLCTRPITPIHYTSVVFIRVSPHCSQIFHRPDLTPSGSSESATPPDGSGESKGGERSDAVRAIMGATSAISEPDSLAPIGDSVVACPICGDTFPHYVVEVHASQCGTDAARGWGAGPIVID